jgi:two-component system response regulator AtoC
MGKPPHVLGAGAEEKLRSYSFPGNVRELENVLERALIFCEGNEIRGQDIDLHRETAAAAASSGAGPPAGDPRSLGELEKEAIITALARSEGNRTRAAEELGVSRKTILNKIRAYGIR